MAEKPSETNHPGGGENLRCDRTVLAQKGDSTSTSTSPPSTPPFTPSPLPSMALSKE